MTVHNEGTIFCVERMFNLPYNFKILIQVLDRTFDEGLISLSQINSSINNMGIF